jgi:hypothetical protein
MADILLPAHVEDAIYAFHTNLTSIAHDKNADIKTDNLPA